MSTTPQDTALATIEKLTAVQLFQPGAVDPMLHRIKIEARAKAATLDISKESDRKELASLAYQLARSRTFIDSQRKVLVADEKKRLAVIDREGSRIWDELEALQKEVRAPLTEWEQREKDRVAALEARVLGLENTWNDWQFSTPPDTAAIAAKIEELEAYDVSDMGEFTRRAALAKSESLQKLRPMLAAAQQADLDRAELERHRKEAVERTQREHEENIARQAKERAEEDAKRRIAAAEAQAAARHKAAEEAADQKRKEEADKAEREQLRIQNEARQREETERAAKEAAIVKQREAERAAVQAKADAVAAADKAERDRIAAEKRAEQEKAAAILRERDRVAAAAEAERVANEKRENSRRIRARVHNQMLTAFKGAGFDEDTAKKIVEMIAKGDVPHCSVTY